MIAILTKFHGPTNSRGARVTAKTTSGLRKTIGWDHSLDVEGNHRAAAVALCVKMNWTGTPVEGGMDVGYAYVFDCEWARIPLPPRRPEPGE